MTKTNKFYKINEIDFFKSKTFSKLKLKEVIIMIFSEYMSADEIEKAIEANEETLDKVKKEIISLSDFKIATEQLADLIEDLATDIQNGYNELQRREKNN